MPEIPQDVTSRSINNKQFPKRDDSELLWVFRCREGKREDTGSLGECGGPAREGVSVPHVFLVMTLMTLA